MQLYPFRNKPWKKLQIQLIDAWLKPSFETLIDPIHLEEWDIRVRRTHIFIGPIAIHYWHRSSEDICKELGW